MNNDTNWDSPWNRFSSMDNERINFDNLFNEQFETDVPGLECDATYKKGIDAYPVFDVTQKDFNNNMEEFRKRIRLSGKAGEYLRNTRYSKPFYIRHTEEDTGKVFIRKVK